MIFQKYVRKPITLLLTIIMLVESLPVSVFALYIDEKYSFLTSVDQKDSIPDGYIAIDSVADLDSIRNAPSGKYILTGDIDLSTYSHWTPIDTFSGVLDGNGYVISNISQTIDGGTTQTMTGVFETNAGTIQNLGVKDCTVTGVTTSGVLLGGGLVAVNQGVIENCYVSGTLDMTVTSPSITAVGALCALNSSAGTVSGCHSLCNIQVLSQEKAATQLECGGMVGENKGTVRNCVYSSGNLSINNANGTTFTGGIVGRTTTSLQDCGNLGNIHVEAVGDVTAGGITALLDGNYVVERSFNYGNVEVTSTEGDVYNGGIVGLATVDEGTTTSSQNYNEGTITAKTSSSSANAAAGGIAGVLQGYYHIRNSYNNGYICVESNGKNASAGGIVGNFILNIAYGTVENTYNTGKVESSRTTQAGGLIGLYSYSYVVISNSVKNSYSMNATTLIGSGSTSAVIEDTCKNYNDDASAMELASTYSGFDFTNIWMMEEGYVYPSLRNNPRIVLIPDIESQRNILQYRADSVSNGDYDIRNVSTYYEYALTTDAGACAEVIDTLGAGMEIFSGLWNIVADAVQKIDTGVPSIITAPLEQKDIYAAILLDMLECKSDTILCKKEYSDNAILKHTMKLTELLGAYLKAEHNISDEALYYTWLKEHEVEGIESVRVCITTYAHDQANEYDYLTKTINDVNGLNKYNGHMQMLIKNAGSIENMISQYISYSMLYDLADTTKEILYMLADNCNGLANPALKAALKEIIAAFELKSEEELNKYCTGEYLITLRNNGLKWAYQKIWSDFTESLDPWIVYALTVYKFGKYIVDEAFGTSQTVEAYYKMFCVLDIENLLIQTLEQAYSDYKYEKNNTNAEALLYLLELRSKITKIDIETAESYMKVANWDESWEAYIAKKKENANELHFQLNTGWLLQLQEEEPDCIASYTGYWIDAWHLCRGRYPDYFLDDSVVVLENRYAEAVCIEIACPVHVYVYGPDGELVAYAADGTVYTDSAIAVTQYGDKKQFYITDFGKYTIQCVGYDVGTMDVALTHYEGTDVTRRTEYYDVPVTVGSTYTMAYTMENAAEQESVMESGSTGTILPDYDTITVGTEKFAYVIKNGYLVTEKSVNNTGELCAYESAELIPIVPDGYCFIGWTSSLGEGVFIDSKEQFTRLVMPTETVTVEAVIEPTEAKVPTIQSTLPEILVYATDDAAEPLCVEVINHNPEGVLTYEWFCSAKESLEDSVSVGVIDTFVPPVETAGTMYYYVVVTNTVHTSKGEMTASAISTPVKIIVWDRGDVNTDGAVDLLDSKILSAYYSGYPVEMECKTADMDLDGYLTRRDAMILARHIDGWAGYDLPYILNP